MKPRKKCDWWDGKEGYPNITECKHCVQRPYCKGYKYMKPYPQWICNDCGEKASQKHFGVSAFHMGICGVCGKKKAVTEPRDFYYPEFKGHDVS